VQFDGFCDTGSPNPYHINSLYKLRMDKEMLLDGYGNQVVVRRQGMVEPRVALAADLETAVSSGKGFYVRSRIPDTAFSEWTRNILYLKDRFTIVLDEIRARDAGRFDVSCEWDATYSAIPWSVSPRFVQAKNGATITSSLPVTVTVPPAFGNRRAIQRWCEDLQTGESCVIGNLIYRSREDGICEYTLEPIGKRGLLVSGDSKAFACFGSYGAGEFRVEAEAAYLSKERIFAANMQTISW
ncbi:unnamed protein product, partial [marine sediment metagenome]